MPEQRRQPDKPVWKEILPDTFWDGKDPAEWVGREFVGDRQRTIVIRGDNDAIQYRVGLNERFEIIVDRMALDRYFPSSEPTRLELADAPETILAEAQALLGEYAPEAAGASAEPKAKSKATARSGPRPRARSRRAQKSKN
jgi:hypothetical protein